MFERIPIAFHVRPAQGCRHACVVAGEVDLATAPRLDKAIRELERRRLPMVQVDLAEVSFMDVTGLRVLLDAARRANEDGHRFTISRPQPNVRRLLELAAIDQSLEMIDEPPTPGVRPGGTGARRGLASLG